MGLKEQLLEAPPGTSVAVDAVRESLARARVVDVSDAFAYLRSVPAEREFAYDAFPSVRPPGGGPLLLEGTAAPDEPFRRMAFLVQTAPLPSGPAPYDAAGATEVLTVAEFKQGFPGAGRDLPALFRATRDIGASPYALVLTLAKDGRVVLRSGGSQHVTVLPFIDVPAGAFGPEVLKESLRMLYSPLLALCTMHAARPSLARIEKGPGGTETLKIDGLRRTLNAAYKARELGLGRALTLAKELFDGGEAA